MSLSEILLYSYSANASPPPSSGQFRTNAVAAVDVDRLYVHNVTSDGIDLHVALADVEAGALVYLQDKNDHTVFAKYEVLEAPTDHGDYLEYVVGHLDSAGTFNGGQASIIYLATPPAGSGGGGVLPASLVTLARAKTHLRITDDDHDDDVAQKAAAASQIIVKYLKGNADPTWDVIENPPPYPVEAAILLMLGHLYEHRGDNMAPDADLWTAIETLLGSWRQPTFA